MSRTLCPFSFSDFLDTVFTIELRQRVVNPSPPYAVLTYIAKDDHKHASLKNSKCLQVRFEHCSLVRPTENYLSYRCTGVKLPDRISLLQLLSDVTKDPRNTNSFTTNSIVCGLEVDVCRDLLFAKLLEDLPQRKYELIFVTVLNAFSNLNKCNTMS